MVLSKASKLSRIQALKLKPFYSSKTFELNEQDKKDKTEYYKLQEELEEFAKKLKKGDKVVFNFPEKIKGSKNSFGLPSYKDVFYEGVVSKPLYTKKRTIMGEDASFDIIKVTANGYIYPVIPDQIEKILS